MKKLRLTESNLVRLIRKVINEDGMGSENFLVLKNTRQNPLDRPNDPYLYANEGDKYYVAKKNDPTNWTLVTNTNVINAIKKLFSTPTDETSTVGKNSSSGAILIFAFPTYKPSLEKGDILSTIWQKLYKVSTGENPTKFPPVGHGGCVVVDSMGRAVLFEFGRYEGRNAKQGMGLVVSKNLGKIGKMENGKLVNYQDVAIAAKRNTQGDGPRMRMEGVVFKLPKPQKAVEYALSRRTNLKYDLSDMSFLDDDANCGTFAIEVAKAGGSLVLATFCNPLPIALITSLRSMPWPRNQGSFSV
jgi:hypothetical protein